MDKKKYNKKVYKSILFTKIKDIKIFFWRLFHKNNSDAHIDRIAKPEGAKEVGARFCGERRINQDAMVHIYHLEDKGYIGYLYFYIYSNNGKKFNYAVIADKKIVDFNNKIDMKINQVNEKNSEFKNKK